MRAVHRTFAVASAVGLVLLVGACAGNSIDNGNGPDVVLEVFTFPAIAPIQAAYNDALGGCVFTAPAAVSVTLRNQPKSAFAGTSPFNDVAVHSASVTYYWDDAPTTAIGPLTQSTSGTIPAGGTGSVSFSPVPGDLLTSDRAGHTANIIVSFHGTTVSGDAVDSVPAPPGGAVVFINSCIPSGG